MQINSIKQNNVSFKGYDARRLQGFLIKSDYANIPAELKQIGDLEGFKVFLMKRGKQGGYIETRKMSSSDIYQSGWTQDFWGIVGGKKLLTMEDNFYTDAIMKFFKIRRNKLQQEYQQKPEITARYKFMNTLRNLPEITADGETKYILTHPSSVDAGLFSQQQLNMLMEKTFSEISELLHKNHPPGGNYFICRGKDGKDELLIGADELEKFDIESIKKLFGVEKVQVIPQADVHLDFFIRPLDKKRVLVSDDEMMTETAEKIVSRTFQEAERLKSQGETAESPLMKSLAHIYSKFSELKAHLIKAAEGNNRPSAEEVEKALQAAGYEPIRVPGRIYNNLGTDAHDVSIVENIHNYMNANALLNKQGDLVYITNKSNFDEKMGITPEIEKRLGISLRKAFEDKLKPYIPENKIYYVSGKNDAIPNEILPTYRGGIHCLTAEVPELQK